MARPFRRNQLVRIGNGRKVYRVDTVLKDSTRHWYWLEADAKHPDAARRVPDALRWYRSEELRPVEVQ
ncbi:Uncharacterised protein [Mycobacteroides abscessus subsp. abscessus]|uniref:hypothetical protein n=1 Tax=Mycobacteroides abscessus TaxID=36809 RepID=UPI0009260F3F|nr:hypothetical protein [Mycobacteroides abscessus]SIG07427.1 Uncharacterised protein [Mycobacteroides abscessus subsp. abscessus]